MLITDQQGQCTALYNPLSKFWRQNFLEATDHREMPRVRAPLQAPTAALGSGSDSIILLVDNSDMQRVSGWIEGLRYLVSGAFAKVGAASASAAHLIAAACGMVGHMWVHHHAQTVAGSDLWVALGTHGNMLSWGPPPLPNAQL